MLDLRFNVRYLEQQVRDLATFAGIDPDIWRSFLAHLAPLKEHNEPMYAHSLRVGVYTYGISVSEDQSDWRFPLFAGCGHDIGKCDVPNSLLDSKDLQPAEFEVIKQHAENGFNRLKDEFLFAGLIAGTHHYFRDGGYGIDLREMVGGLLSEESIAIVEAMARQVMIADFFDALTTRNNNKGFIDDPSDPEQQLAVMTKHFPDQPERIAWLIEHAIR